MILILVIACLLAGNLFLSDSVSVSAKKKVTKTTNVIESGFSGETDSTTVKTVVHNVSTVSETTVTIGTYQRYVTYNPEAVSKGYYTTPIWNQHHIWKKKSSAARHGCGICVTAMALRLNGVAATPDTVLKQTNRSVRKCKSLKPKQALKTLKKNNISASLVSTKDYTRRECTNMMKQALNEGKMVMAVVRGKPFSGNTHWVLIVGYDKNGKVVVANSSYGNRKICKKTKKQYHLVTWKQIRKKIVRDSVKYSAFIIVG